MFYISTDLEGMSGLWHSPTIPDDEIMCAHMTAAAEGLRAGGAKRVLLTSMHGIPPGLPAFVEALREHRETPGWADLPAFSRDCRGLLLLGFHGVWTPQAYGHSYKYPNLWLNGRKCGEITIQFMLAADLGVPAVMLAGNAAAVAEAREVVPDILTVTTRPGLAGDEGPLDPHVMSEIRRVAAAAVRRPARPPVVPERLVLEVPFRAALPAEIAQRLPYPVTRKDNVVGRAADNFADIYRFLLDTFECVYEARRIERQRGGQPQY